jgi:hypothetical protein
MRKFVDDFHDLMPHSVTVEHITGRDQYGKPVYADPVVYPNCRVVYRNTRVSTTRGEAVGHSTVAAGYVIFGDVVDLSIDDRITLPDGKQPPILSIESPSDERGAVYTKAFFGAV